MYFLRLLRCYLFRLTCKRNRKLVVMIVIFLTRTILSAGTPTNHNNAPKSFNQSQYATQIASLQHLNPSPFRINIRKFCPTIIGCSYWNDIPISICQKPTKQLFLRALFQYYFAQYQSLPHDLVKRFLSFFSSIYNSFPFSFFLFPFI